MIYAVRHNKIKRESFKGNEDSLTSSIFERLMYLPKELLQHIFTKALFNEIEGLNLHQIEEISYWPNWSATGTSNVQRVEPDIFIRCATQDIIIEAKRYDEKQQSRTQWENEIQAYYNEYADDNKPLIFIALGGLHTNATETIAVNDTSHNIYKCSWSGILNTVQGIIHDMELATDYTHNNVAINNILKDIILCFELFGFSTSPWLERFVKPTNIKQTSIHYFSKKWKN
jgi:hypothetical protein